MALKLLLVFLSPLTKSMEVTLIGRNGVHVVALVEKASKNESDYATIPNQSTVAVRAAVPVPTLGNARLVSVQVQLKSFIRVLPLISSL